MPFDETLLEPVSQGFDESLLEPVAAPVPVPPMPAELRPTSLRERITGARIASELQRQYGAGGAPTPLDIMETGFKFMTPPPPAADVARKVTDIPLSLLPAAPAGIATGIREAALTFPIAAGVLGLGKNVGRALLGLFTGDFILNLPAVQEQFNVARAKGDNKAAWSIATQAILGGALLGTGAAYEIGRAGLPKGRAVPSDVQRQAVEFTESLRQNQPEVFTELAKKIATEPVSEPQRQPAPVPAIPVVTPRREEPAPVPPPPEPPIRDITAPTTEAAEAMRAGVAERLEAGKAAPAAASEAASARAQAAVEAGAARVEAALQTPEQRLSVEPETSPMAVMRQHLREVWQAAEEGRPFSGVAARDYWILHKVKGFTTPFDYDPAQDRFVPVSERPQYSKKAWNLIAKLDTLDLRLKSEGEKPEIADQMNKLTRELADEMGWKPEAPPAEKALTAPAAGETVKGVTTTGPELTARDVLVRKYADLLSETDIPIRQTKNRAKWTTEAQAWFDQNVDLSGLELSDRSISQFRNDVLRIASTKRALRQPAAPAAQPEGVKYAPEERKVEEGREPEHPGTEAQRLPTAPSGGYRPEPSTTEPKAPEVLLTPPAAEAAKPTAQSTKAGEATPGAAAGGVRVPSSLEFEGMPRPQEMVGVGAEMARDGKYYVKPGTPVPEGIEPYAGAKGLVSATPAEGKRGYVTDPEDGKLHEVLMLKRVGEWDNKPVWTFMWTEGPSKGQPKTTYSFSFWDLEKGAAAGGPLPIGPGAAAAAPGGIPSRAAIEQLADAFAGKAPTAERLAAFVRNAFNFGARGAKAKDALSAAVQGMKTSGTALWDALTKFQTPDDLLKAKGDLSAELETRGWRVRQFVRNVQASVPDKSRRAAIAKWIDAGGDDAVLAAGEAATKPEYKQAYRDARNLTPDEKIQAQNIQNYFDTRLQEAIDAGVLEHGLDDYIHRIYEKDPSLIKRALAYVQSGILSRNPALAKKRLFEFDWQAEQQGFRPVQDFLPRIAAYEASLSRAIAARKFVQRMSQLTAADGRPVVGIRALGIPVEDQAGVRESTLIRPRGDFRKAQNEWAVHDAAGNILGTFKTRQGADAYAASHAGTTIENPHYRGDYEQREFPALSKWKWVSTDAGGKPIFVQGDVAIHPDYVKRVDALLKPSSVRKYAPLRTAQAISATVKQTMLDMSFFHQVQIAVHGLEHRVNPFRLVQTIDFENPNVQGLLKGGVTLGGEYYPSNLGEGLVGRSLTQHIPGLGQILETYHGWLFQDFIPRMKMTMALHALERNRVRYARDLASGRMSEDALHLLTAKQANAAFGELNYTMLERNKTVQDMARLILLAPDFLEARGRFVAQALTKYGTEQRVALLLGAITMWTAARVMNKIADDQWHFEPENLFNLVWKNHAYGLRTVQGDVLHMLTQPLQFWMNRLNPVYTRNLMELATQRDQFGRKRSPWQIITDAVSTAIPIAFRSGRERPLIQSLFNSFGVTARRYNDVKNAHELADAWKKKNNVREQPGEFIYDSDKDPLRPLKLALSDQDESGAVKELKRVLDRKVMTPEQVERYFMRYAAAPFTGSKANEVKFLASLSPDERKTVQAAQEHRQAMLGLYRKARQQLGVAVNLGAGRLTQDPRSLYR